MSDTLKHIEEVREAINIVVVNLLDRADVHDASKLREPELSFWAVESPIMRGIEDEFGYGSVEWKAQHEKCWPMVTLHHTKNDHHPEFNGIENMSAMAILEMLADWKAASRGRLINLTFQIIRFEVGEQLESILKATLDELAWEWE